MQSTVNTALARGLPGGIADNGPRDIISVINNSKQVEVMTVTAVDLATVLTINGTGFTANSGAASKTKAEISTEMVTLVNAGAEPVTAYLYGTEQVQIVADVSGTSFTIVGTTNCTVANQIPNEISIPFGVIVVQDKSSVNVTGLDSDPFGHLPSVTGEITDVGSVLGVTVHRHSEEQAMIGTASVGYKTQSVMDVMKKGRVFVQVETAVKIGGLPFVRFSATGTEQRGAFRHDADTADAVTLPNASFRIAAIASGIAIVELNLP